MHVGSIVYAAESTGKQFVELYGVFRVVVVNRILHMHISHSIHILCAEHRDSRLAVIEPGKCTARWAVLKLKIEAWIHRVKTQLLSRLLNLRNKIPPTFYALINYSIKSILLSNDFSVINTSIVKLQKS